uniref:CUB domain-containing protein n=1 Tax=Strongyloides stercoralis TaxID=6248 RepID=A0A0K0DVU2_STRER
MFVKFVYYLTLLSFYCVFCKIICNGYSDYIINQVNHTDIYGTRKCDTNICIYFNGFIVNNIYDKLTQKYINYTYHGNYVGCLEEFEKFIYSNSFMEWPEMSYDLKTCNDSKNGFNFRFVDRLNEYYGAFNLKCTKNGNYQNNNFKNIPKTPKYDDYLDQIYIHDTLDKHFSNNETFSDNTTSLIDVLDSIEIKINDIKEQLSNESFPPIHIINSSDIENSYILPSDDPMEHELIYYHRDTEIQNNNGNKTIFYFNNILQIFMLTFLTLFF